MTGGAGEGRYAASMSPQNSMFNHGGVPKHSDLELGSELVAGNGSTEAGDGECGRIALFEAAASELDGEWVPAPNHRSRRHVARLYQMPGSRALGSQAHS